MDRKQAERILKAAAALERVHEDAVEVGKDLAGGTELPDGIAEATVEDWQEARGELGDAFKAVAVQGG